MQFLQTGIIFNYVIRLLELHLFLRSRSLSSFRVSFKPCFERGADQYYLVEYSLELSLPESHRRLKEHCLRR